MSIRTDKKHLGSLTDKFTIDDVGSSLLQELAQGLYTPPEVIREYIQNAVDSHRLWFAETSEESTVPIRVQIRGKSITFFDGGIGMDEEEIRNVKSIAVSRKRVSDVRLAGHKGVGIWAGLSYFKKLRLYSTKYGSKKAYELIIDFASIVSAIDEDKSIGDVLNPNYQIEVYETDPDEHGAVITLSEPVRAEEDFINEEPVANALKRICPCKIHPSFVFYNELLEWHNANGLDLHNIYLNGEPVYKSFPSVVDNFTSGVLTINDRAVAHYWYAINKKNRILPSTNGELVGFRTSVEGFTIGETNLYSRGDYAGFAEIGKSISSRLDWYVGEFAVLDKDLRPNLQRREFETSEFSRQYIQRIRKWYEELDDKTRFTSAKRIVSEKYANMESVLTKANIGKYEADLLSFLKELHNDGNKILENRGNRNPPKEIQALKDQAAKRNILIKSIDGILTQLVGKKKLAEMLAEASKTNPSNKGIPSRRGAQSGNSATEIDVDGSDNGDEAGEYDEISNPVQLSSSGEASQNLSGYYSIFLDTLLGLLEEILEEIFPNSSKKTKRVLSLLRKRSFEAFQNDK